MQEKTKKVFQKLGGSYQLMIEDASDLHFIASLDEAHWITTSADLNSFNCDKLFLKYIDTDNDSRITSKDVKESIVWLSRVLNDFSVLNTKDTELNLNSINTETEEGKKIKNAAQRILENLQAQDNTKIDIKQVQNRHKILAAADSNGDGIIPPESITSKKLREFALDIMATIGKEKDISNKEGISQKLLDKFLREAEDYLSWYTEGKKVQKETGMKVMVRESKTPLIYAEIEQLRGKIDEFFLYCQLLKTDETIKSRFKFEEKAIKELDINSESDLKRLLKEAPLASPSIDLTLNINDKINPFYLNQIKGFQKSAINNADSLTLEQWEKLKEEFAQFADWTRKKTETKVDSLGIEKLEEYLTGTYFIELKKLFDADFAVAEEIKQICQVEKLLLFKKVMFDFVNDFISLSSLFNPEKTSMLQFGRLVLDGRHFDLCIKINNINDHKKIASKSNICIMYLGLTRYENKQKTSALIATAVTSGSVKNIFIGKRGIFISGDGKHWDAIVTDFIKHPVSLSEALLMPFEKLSAFFKKQTEKITGSSYNKVEKSLGESLSNIEKIPIQQAKTNPPAPAQKSAWSTPLFLLGGGIGLAGVGSAFESVSKAWKYVSVMQVLMFFAALVLILIVPIIFAAVIKLRSRNIGIFLEASGRALNAPLRLTYKMGVIFTKVPPLPANSYKIIFDKISDFFDASQKKKTSLMLKLFLIISVLTAAAAAGYFLFNYFIYQ